MSRILLVLAMGACLAGCWPSACVIEREPWAADLCDDGIETLWDEPPEPDAVDLHACAGEEHLGETCSSLDFTVPCGRFRIRPDEFCDQ